MLTLLEAIAPPPEMPSVAEPLVSTPLSWAAAMPSLPTSETSAAAWTAVTDTAPVAVIAASRIQASASEGCSPLNAVEISGSPRIASTALKRMFDGFQPIVLKARTAPKVLSKPSICERATADSGRCWPRRR